MWVFVLVPSVLLFIWRMSVLVTAWRFSKNSHGDDLHGLAEVIRAMKSWPWSRH